jgi:predicted nuclease of restriction endonuclease-like RecB superfamily
LLTADLVHVRRRGDRLLVVPLGESDQARARDLAATAISLIKAHLGLPRGALLEALGEIAIAPSENRLARGLWKLALDTCEFDEGDYLDPVALRREIFLRAANLRQGQTHAFDRAAVLREIAEARQVSTDAIEEALYADLPSAHILRTAHLPSPDGLVASYDLAQHQAVLLRAVRVRARVFCPDAAGYRYLFRKLKFHRLLYTIAKLDRTAGYTIDIDGPYSLFEQTTKYGLRLALALPAIMACARWDVTADLRWGKDRRPLRYHARAGDQTLPEGASADDALPDDAAALLADLHRLDSPWRASAADAILDLPGLGVCIPDLQFVHRETGQRVFLELLGFWSRAAVWKRVEMVERGLDEPVVFAVSKHLRVSEEVLPDRAPASLYVYARMPNASAIVERVAEVAARARPGYRQGV